MIPHMIGRTPPRPGRSPCWLALTLFVTLTAACADRATNDPDSGSIWPDVTFIDAAVESGPRPDVTADLPQSDLPLVDAPVPDASNAGWKPVAISFPLTEDLHAVDCVQGHVYAVGNKGTVIHYDTIKGSGFALQTISTTSDLHAVTFADLTYGVVAGKDATIWQTQNLGAIWSTAPQCSAYVFATFYALHLHTANEGFAAGEAVNSAGAGAKYYEGYSWVCTSPTYPSAVFYDVFRLKDSGWIVGDTKGLIYTSSDKGYTWKSVSAGTTEILRGVQFVSASQGVAVGAKGLVVRSTDGKGEVWAKVTTPVTADLWDVHFFDASKGWAVGDKGTVLQTTDGGKSWTAQVSGAATRLEGVCFTSATEGWAVGEKGTLLHTTTGGL